MTKFAILAAASFFAFHAPAGATADLYESVRSDTFSQTNVSCTDAGPCSFSIDEVFNGPLPFAQFIFRAYTATDSYSVDLTSVYLNGELFGFQDVSPYIIGGQDLNGTVYTGSFAPRTSVLATGNLLTINGITDAPGGPFSSNVAYVTATRIFNASAVPEPATWAMMLLGFGMIGGAIRYRRRQPKVTWAIV